MAEKKIAILGGKGMLGTDLGIACGQQGLIATVFDLPEFDITRPGQARDVVSDYDLIVNCAAYTNVEKAQSEEETAYRVNSEAVGSLGAAAGAKDRWVLHVSTDFVFDGKSERPYVETDEPNPVNVYGKSKLSGEKMLLESGCRNCILRTEWTYGQGGNNFVKKLLSLAKTGKSLKVVDDQVGAPTATAEVAQVICKLLQKEIEGVFHFANEGYVSRYEMARFIFDKLEISVDLARCKSSDYITAAVRPLSSRFDCGKIEGLLNESISPWQGPLERYLRQL